jgi:hypothetical protein
VDSKDDYWSYYPTRFDVGRKFGVVVTPRGVWGQPSETIYLDGEVPYGPYVQSNFPYQTVYGTPFTATVTLWPNEEGDVVEDGVIQIMTEDGEMLAEGTSIDGRAEIPVPGDALPVGNTIVLASYLGTAQTPPAASRFYTSMWVDKIPSSVTTSLRTSVRYTSRATIGIAVEVAGVPNPTGELRIYDGSRRIAYAVLSSSDEGKRSILLPRLAKGYHYIKVVYSGTSVIESKTSVTRRIKSY